MAAPVRPSLARVCGLLAYDPETGVLTWRVTRGGTRAGEVAGYIAPGGYRYVSIDGEMQLAHLLIWFMQTGEWPPRKIDHRNRVRDDNRWSNLRLATDGQNAMNCEVRSDNSSGHRGVCLKRSRWRAYLSVDGRQKNLGTFATKAEAVAVREAAEKQHFGEFAPC